jgi:hypothetical protein
MASARQNALSPLAARIYAILRRRVPSSRNAATMTYKQIALRVGVSHRGPALDRALGELVTRCRSRGLPAIAALVVRADLGIPGAGYYGLAHGIQPRPRPVAALAWAREVVLVCSTSYPTVL